MIQTKLKECSVCHKQCKLWKASPKLCKDCAGKANSNKPLTEAEKTFKKELNVFFASETLVMPYICDNCDLPLYAFSASDKRACIAHILPKSMKQSVGFPTVSTHPQNKLFLCAKGGCHSKWDNKGVEDRLNMKVYDLAIQRFNKFKHLLTEAEIIKANKYLGL